MNNKNNEVGEYGRLISYSLQLSMLSLLFTNKLITDNEYNKIKNKLMKKYKISSDLTC